jgi:hypothetical protein
MRQIILWFIHAYRYCISPLLMDNCRFYPSCSCYAQEAIHTFGVAKGTTLTVKRLLKCHPYHPGGFDPIPNTTDKKDE